MHDALLVDQVIYIYKCLYVSLYVCTVYVWDMYRTYCIVLFLSSA